MKFQAGVEVVKLPRKGQPQIGPGTAHWIRNDLSTAYKTACGKSTAGMVTSYLEVDKISCPVCTTELVAFLLVRCEMCGGDGTICPCNQPAF